MGASFWYVVIDSTKAGVIKKKWKQITIEETQKIIADICSAYIPEITADLVRGVAPVAGANRKGPPYHASAFAQGVVLSGKDGGCWIKKGKRWARLFSGGIARRAATVLTHFGDFVAYSGTLGFYGSTYVGATPSVPLKTQKAARAWLIKNHEKWQPAALVTFGAGKNKKTMIGGWASD
jgi:hypothetical protein